jgi:hypothetical protein
MTRLERNEYDPVIRPDGRAIAEGEIVRASWQTDIVNDDPAFGLGNHLADLVLDRLEDALCRFDPGSGRSPDMQLYLTAVDQRKEVATHEEE